MKNTTIQATSLLISLLWIGLMHQTLNPFALKGPEFLSFYSILLFGWYITLLFAKFYKGSFSKTTVVFGVFIFIFGAIKFVKGVYLGKPVGLLILMLIIQVIVFTAIIRIYSKES
ncbi:MULTISPECIES: hypothetical protein [Chryseobacterium]|uniref:DUF4345 domain-containing protein n=1 Tax=Chryseobacterium camelliae TaxID=1265445 RepID=A0ABU0TM96_9FLAO|nr:MULTISPECIES: hypothetical protein [Chryseobacterium]MDT3407969.1 hypothetical protein [Pseudacidovorax intermedius]MDQ1098172.1 hypothetical protein [Chryseobacterium camelliae]MDQ1102102.1 hypothetical protein [Chryseobacterium sp. SORGH_AS_1048]MDR6085540.1 hypothetical protein [Chryseobacterium sp. SORGH_AS_0909]MDR6129902.1 hypothetical protein [Chryseobacterium sp. SORGH_AS_1175]